MVVTQFGRVEFDPMSVPLAARFQQGRTDSFAERLDAATRATEPEAAPVPDDAEAPTPVATAADPEVEPEAATPVDATAAPVDRDPTPAAPVPVAVETNLPSRAEPARRIQADEGAGSSLESPAAPARAPAPTTTGASATTAAAVTAPFAGSFATTAAPAAAVAPKVADHLVGIQGATPLRAAGPKALLTGYRLVTPQTLQLDAQARDSVFQQILFKLGDGGGEMRLRLHPPELGELDLHLVVENGNSLRLSIGAERPELRDLLQKGLGELEQRLAAGGLQVVHAEVHDRPRSDARPHGEAAATAGRDGHDHDHDAGTATLHRPGTGWYTADGLDFWA